VASAATGHLLRRCVQGALDPPADALAQAADRRPEERLRRAAVRCAELDPPRLEIVVVDVDREAPRRALDRRATGGVAQRGWDQSARINVWSRQPGGIDAEQALAAVSAVLEQGRLTISGHHLVMMRLEMQTVFADPDGETTHGVQRYQIITRETA